MIVAAGELDGYTRDVAAQQRSAQVYAESSVRAFMDLNPGAPVADVREYAIAVLEQAGRIYGDAGAVIAAAEYDRLMAAAGVGAGAASPSIGVNREQVEKTVRYLAGMLVRGDAEGFVSAIGSKAYDAPLRAANSTMAGNATRDYGRGVRYARVPTGRETCGFCLMLASRGFTYRSRRLAGDIGNRFNTYHDRCDCRVVAGTEDTVVEGYDPDALYEVYAECRAIAEQGARGTWSELVEAGGTEKPYSKWLTDRICSTITRRLRAERGQSS